MKRENNFSRVLRVAVISAFFAAVSMVLGKYLAIGVGDVLRFSFENLPIIFIGFAFGPIIGAIPCGLLVFIAEPRKLITFIIVLLVIQQIDANILDPMITGNATGISSLGVIISVTVMGNYFGIIGMFIGVPVVVSLLTFLPGTVQKSAYPSGPVSPLFRFLR